MDHELAELRQRVEVMERTLAAASHDWRRNQHDWRRNQIVRRSGLVSWAWLATGATAALLFSSALSSSTVAVAAGTVPPGPTVLAAPFTVIGSDGRALLQVFEPNGTGSGGRLTMYNGEQKGVLTIGTSSSGCCGTVYVFRGDSPDQPKAALGVDTGDNGMLRLQGDDGMFAQASGTGFAVKNPSAAGGEEGAFVALSADREDGGFLHLRNTSADPSVNLFAESKGGHVQVVTTPRVDGVDLAAAESGARLMIVDKGGSKVIISHNENGTGRLSLFAGSGLKGLAATGDAQIFGRNSAGLEVASLGVDRNNQGYFMAMDDSGKPKAILSVGSDGTGMAQVFKSNELGVIMGTKDGTKGDVCANGPQSSVCLSVLAAKTFTKY